MKKIMFYIMSAFTLLLILSGSDYSVSAIIYLFSSVMQGIDAYKIKDLNTPIMVLAIIMSLLNLASILGGNPLSVVDLILWVLVAVSRG